MVMGLGRDRVWPHGPEPGPHLLEAVVLLTVGTVPAVAVPVGHYCVLVAEPAVDHGVRRLRPVDRGRVQSARRLSPAQWDTKQGAGWSGGARKMCSIYQEDHTDSGFLAPRGQLETHQILWPQHAHKRTQGLLPLVSWGSGMGTLGGQAGQATGRQGAGSRTALPPHEACPQAVEMVSWGASKQNEPPVGHRR